VGRVDEAQERLEELCRRLPRLLPEEVDPTTGEGLGNVPLVWSHAEAARSLYVVDAALRRARWGAPGLWAWRLGRYARLRWAPATH
jgi:GH15 family glucan-1,4-alpha-glucosidase